MLVVLKEAIEAFQEESDKEGEANILNVDPEVLPLFTEEDTVG